MPVPIEGKPKLSGVERQPAPELKSETPKARPLETLKAEPMAEKAPTAPPVLVAPQASAQVAPSDEITRAIESILEEDLAAVYAELPEAAKSQFKAQGEIVARSIREMISQAKIKTRRVLKLIVGWLKMIPGVNKFFLEQEAAIKTQKIIQIANEQKKS